MRRTRGTTPSSSWERVADWYMGWAGAEGSRHHRELAIPAVTALLALRAGERVLDMGCGAGAFARAAAAAGAHYVGIDSSPKLIAHARRHHAGRGTFIVGDVTRLQRLRGVRAGEQDAVVFLLSIQDIDPLEAALDGAAWALRRGGRLAVLMTHPCFRIPRQSGWGWDAGRRLRFRRVDRYLAPLAIPMQAYGRDTRGSTRSYHRPLEAYVNGFAARGLLVDALREIPGSAAADGAGESRQERLAREEIPLFLALRAVKC